MWRRWMMGVVMGVWLVMGAGRALGGVAATEWSLEARVAWADAVVRGRVVDVARVAAPGGFAATPGGVWHRLHIEVDETLKGPPLAMVDAWSWSSDSYVPVWELRHGEQLLFLKRGSHMVASGVAAYGAVDWAVSEYVPGVDLPEKGASAEPVVGEDLTRLMDTGAVLAAARRAAGEASLGFQGLPLSDADETALGIAPTGLLEVPVTDEMLGVAAG
ncbi:MAG TPA: hypothetical protein VHQ47_11470 [Phycisphaerae bacterium]|nr:hypothetical protein [Phycisphaerae bacterium]